MTAIIKKVGIAHVRRVATGDAVPAVRGANDQRRMRREGKG